MRTNKGKRFYLLDGARGLAAYGVVVYHFYASNVKVFSGLYVLVDFFFVLSGFVLARTYTSKLTPAEARAYIRLRLLRLFPMPVCSIVLVVLFQIALSIKHKFNPIEESTDIDVRPLTVLLALLMLQNFSQSAILLNYPLWSLSAEWITNLCMLAVPIHKKPRLLILVFLAGFASMLLHEVSRETDLELGWLLNSGRALTGFVVGIFIRMHFENKATVKKNYMQLFFVSIVVFIFYFSLTYLEPSLVIFACIPFGLLVFEMARVEQSQPVHRLIKPTCRFLGKVSFGVYVWHIPVHNVVVPTLAKAAQHFNLEWERRSFIDFLLTMLIAIIITYLFSRFVDPRLNKLFK